MNAKVCAGPTPPNPGPTVPIVVATAVDDVTASSPVNDKRMVATANVTRYKRKKDETFLTTSSDNGLPPRSRGITALGLTTFWISLFPALSRIRL